MKEHSELVACLLRGRSQPEGQTRKDSQAGGPLMTGENLNNPTKTRARGPSGRKLPSRKTKTEEEEEEDKERDLER